MVSLSGLVDKSKLSIGVLVWFAGRKQAERWCPGLALDEYRLRSGVPVRLADEKG